MTYEFNWDSYFRNTTELGVVRLIGFDGVAKTEIRYDCLDTAIVPSMITYQMEKGNLPQELV
jgi:hypothetical protein